MNKKFKIGLVIAVVVIVLGLIIGSGLNSSKKNLGEIVIGAPISLTGTAAIDGLNFKNGLEFAKAKLAKEGVNVKIVYEDDQTNPTKTVSAIQKLVSVDKPVALVGPTWSFLADSGAKLINDSKIVAFLPGDTSEIETVQTPYYFHGAPMNAAKDTYSTQWIKDNNLKNIAVIVEQATWGDVHAKVFTKAIKDAGVKLAYVEVIPYGADNAALQAVATRIKTSGADGVLYTGFDKATAVILNKMRDMKINTPILCATEIPVGLVHENVITIQDNVSLIIPTKSQAFDEEYKTLMGKYPGSYTDRAADGLMMIVKALQEKPENVTLRDYMGSKDFSYNGYAGEYKFDQNGDIMKSEWRVVKLSEMVK